MPSIERYYDDIASVIQWNNRMVVLDDQYWRKGAKQLLSCRVVVLRDGVGLHDCEDIFIFIDCVLLLFLCGVVNIKYWHSGSKI